MGTIGSHSKHGDLQMPTYDYVCPENGRELSVFHAMSERITTWGELCDLASSELGQTPRESPVERMIGTGHVLPPRSGKNLGIGGGGGCCSGTGCNC